MARKAQRLSDPTQLTTIVNFILDRSGSMQVIQDATITGFNEYLTGLQAADTPENRFLFSLNLFSTPASEQRYTLTPVTDVRPLTNQTYLPNGGTPLYDAVTTCLADVERQLATRADKPAILTVIMTDGEENSSQTATLQSVKQRIEELTAQGNWTFVYLGTRQDAWVDSATLGIGKQNTMSWQNTNVGTRTVMDNLTGSTIAYANNSMSARGSSASGVLDPSLPYATADFFTQAAAVIAPAKPAKPAKKPRPQKAIR